MKKILTASLLMSIACGAFAADKPLKSIGITVGDLANPFFVAIGRGAEESAKKIGGPGVKKARDAGVIVIAVDVGAQNASATVMSDNTMAGDVSCAYMAKQINGKGNVVIINGPPVTAVIDRVTGCKKTLAGFKDIKILSDNQNAGGSRDGGLTVMSNLLTAHPKIDAVFAINDPTGIGAELAIKQAKRTDIKLITAVDGAPDGQNALKNKAGLFAATASQNPYRMAADAVQVGYDLMNGRAPKQTTVLLPTPIVNKENVAAYAGWVKN